MIEIKAMFTEKSDALRVIEQAQEAERKHLEYFQDGYMEGYDNGWDEALNNVQTILKRYSIGGEKSDLKPVAKSIRPKDFEGQIEKLKEELAEVEEAYREGQGKERVAEELVDLQLAAETGLAMLNLSEIERQNTRKRGLFKNASRGYYNGDYHAS
jgi:NTP pyrophosphatase (non-canonical NTP hydrolase)